MSIPQVIKDLCDRGELVAFDQPADPDSQGPFPSDALAEVPRYIYVRPDIGVLLDNDSDDPRWWDVASDLVHYCEGKLIAVARKGRRDGQAFFRHLDDADTGIDEVWELRCTDPDPQIRIFGRFIAWNVFVGLIWENRPDLDFAAAMRECVTEWGRFFGHVQPVRGPHPDAYLSNTFPVP